MFCGINAVNLDTKGRMAIPTRYRAGIQKESEGKVVITIDTEEPCLLLYPIQAWKEIEQKIETLPSFNRVTRRIQRLLIGHASELEVDGSGRVLIPPLLRNYAGLQKKMMLVGQGKKFEIWDESKWDSGRDIWLTEGLNDKEVPEQLSDLSL